MQQHHSPSLKDHWAQAEKNQNEEENTEISPKVLGARHVQWYVTVWGEMEKVVESPETGEIQCDCQC